MSEFTKRGKRLFFTCWVMCLSIRDSVSWMIFSALCWHYHVIDYLQKQDKNKQMQVNKISDWHSLPWEELPFPYTGVPSLCPVDSAGDQCFRAATILSSVSTSLVTLDFAFLGFDYKFRKKKNQNVFHA